MIEVLCEKVLEPKSWSEELATEEEEEEGLSLMFPEHIMKKEIILKVLRALL